jgi:glycosyltransferase involved in cell wall biosynthesis
MRIIIDEGLTSYGQMSGIGHHMVSLAAHLRELAECDMTRYDVLRKIPRYFRKWAYMGAANLPRLYKRYDIVHHLANYIPVVRGANKHVLTVYDLSALDYSETVSLAWRHFNKIAFKNAVKRADGIIAISQSIANELLQRFPTVPAHRVYVCPTGLRRAFIECRPREENLRSLNLNPYSYFLFVGDLTKRKNLAFMLGAFIEAKQQRLIHQSTQLVLVGKRAWGYAQFKSLVRDDLGVREMGYLSDEQIVTIYQYSKALVFPSIYEGFGMPIIEAMSQNVPIIISNIPTSMELNRAHNEQMFCFELGDQVGLIRLFQHIDAESQSIRSRLNYGDLSPYRYENIAAKHLSFYERVLKDA